MSEELSHREVAELLDLIQRIDCAELSLDYAGFRIRIARGDRATETPGAAVLRAKPHQSPHTPALVGNPETEAPPAVLPPVQSAPTPAGSGAGGAEGGVAAEWVPIRSPMVGTFYAAPSPTAEPFVAIGDKVGEDTTVCMLEVMKLYTEIKAECAGTVARVEAVDGQLVEHDQVLLWIAPQ